MHLGPQSFGSTLGAAVAAAVFASALAGCGKSVQLIAPDDPRSPLKPGFHTTYTFAYKVDSSLFSGSSLINPRLLYSEKEADFEKAPAAFTDTGAPFDQDRREIVWRIPNLRELHGRTYRFTVDAEGISGRSYIPISFPVPGKIVSVAPVADGRMIRLTVRHSADVFGLKFFVRPGRLQKYEIRPEPSAPSGDGVMTFLWDPRKDLEPQDSLAPVAFSVEYENWYFEKSGDSLQTELIRIPPCASTGEPAFGPDGTLRVPLRIWGKTGFVALEYSKDGQWRTSSARIEEKGSGLAEILWDIKTEGLHPLSGALKYRLSSSGSVIFEGEILPPKPLISVVSFVQEGRTLALLFEASFAEASDVRVFAGAGSSQRLVGKADEIQRKAGLLAIKIDGLPVERAPDGAERLFVYLTARNPSGDAGVEVQVPLLSVKLGSVRQVQDAMEIEYRETPGSPAPNLSYRITGAEEWTEARRVARDGGLIRWSFVDEFGGAAPAHDIRLKAESGGSYDEAVFRNEPLFAVFGEPSTRRNGVFEIPATVLGRHDWVLFEHSLDGGATWSGCKGASYDSAAGTVAWEFWKDVDPASYAGEKASLRAAFRNARGFFKAAVPGLSPRFLRLGRPSVADGRVLVPVRHSEGMGLSFFVSMDKGRTFQPVLDGKTEAGSFGFDLPDARSATGAQAILRAVGSDESGGRMEEQVEIGLPVGILREQAYWSRGNLFIEYEVDRHVPEKDVKIEFATASPGLKPAAWLEASVPEWKVFDVNRRGFSWEVARDMARAGTRDSRNLHLRISIPRQDRDVIVREVPLSSFPPPPITPLKPAVGLVSGCRVFTLGGVAVPAGQQGLESGRYEITAEFIDPKTTHFHPAKPARGISVPDGFAWDKEQSKRPLAAGTWVKVTVTLKSDPKVTGFALFQVEKNEEEGF